jgi:hypothetical protein
VEYDLREVKFRNVSLLLTSLNQGAIRKQAFFTTPSLRVKAEDNIRCRMGYPVVNTAESESDPIYFPPVRYNSRLLPGNSLCGIISVSAEESKERFFVLWGFNHITRINFPWESSVRTRHGSPWCRIIDWCDIMGYADWSEYMQKGLLDHFYKRAEAIMIAFNDGNDKCCPEELETELMSCAARWAKDEMKSIDTRVSDTGERIQIRIKDVLFLGRVLFELQIS